MKTLMTGQHMAGTGNDTREKAKEEEKGNQVMNIT